MAKAVKKAAAKKAAAKKSTPTKKVLNHVPGEIVNPGKIYQGDTQAWERGVDLDLTEQQ